MLQLLAAGWQSSSAAANCKAGTCLHFVVTGHRALTQAVLYGWFTRFCIWAATLLNVPVAPVMRCAVAALCYVFLQSARSLAVQLCHDHAWCNLFASDAAADLLA
jgi:hypothetical protein